MSSENRFNDSNYIEWAKIVKSRDNYCCQICDKNGGDLNAHHMFSWDQYHDLRYDIDNGVTLCHKHHMDFHNRYGFGQNTKEQFEEYAGICEIFKNILYKKSAVKFLTKKILQKYSEKDKDE